MLHYYLVLRFLRCGLQIPFIVFEYLPSVPLHARKVSAHIILQSSDDLISISKRCFLTRIHILLDVVSIVKISIYNAEYRLIKLFV